MSLYDIMNRRRAEDEPEVHPEMPLDNPQDNVPRTDAVPEQKAQKPDATFKYPLWWETPNYTAAVDRMAETEAKRMADEERRGKRERSLAILSDIARLGADLYATSGGAWNVKEFKPQTQSANERLAAMRMKHAEQVAAFARERENAVAADKKYMNELMKEELDRITKAEDKANELKYRDQLLNIRKMEAETAATNAATRGNAMNKFRAYDEYGNAHYFNTKAQAEWFAQQEGTYVGNPVEEVSVEYGVDRYGDPVTITKTRTSTRGGSSRKPGEKKKNPMNGKKANPMN